VPGPRSLTVHRTLEEHLNPLLLRSRAILAVSSLAVLALIVLVCLIIPTAIGRVAVATSIAVATSSAYLAGNSYRLRDVRRRVGNLLRHRTDDEANGHRSQLPPRTTIAQRFRISRYGIVIGVFGLIASAVIGYFTSDSAGDGSWYLVAALLGIVFTALIFVAATYSRPLD
jgi:F0F1-type ATP synthase assembly protein I